jgi:hypothetical protein
MKPQAVIAAALILVMAVTVTAQDSDYRSL